jgi:hypothetical protein
MRIGCIACPSFSLGAISFFAKCPVAKKPTTSRRVSNRNIGKGVNGAGTMAPPTLNWKDRRMKLKTTMRAVSAALVLVSVPSLAGSTPKPTYEYIDQAFSIHAPDGRLWADTPYLYVQGQYDGPTENLPDASASLDLVLFNTSWPSITIYKSEGAAPERAKLGIQTKVTAVPLDQETVLVTIKLPESMVYAGTFVFTFNLKDKSKTTGYFLSAKGIKYSLQPEQEIAVSLRSS